MNDLFGIFMVFDPECPRPVRLTFFYLKVSLLMAITGEFT